MEYWPSGIRDTAKWPVIDITITRDFREHLETFLLLNGVGWRNYDDQRTAAETEIADSRLRTYRKMYERLGLIHKENDEIRLTSFAQDLVRIENRLKSDRDKLIQNLRERAARILSRYQFVNPSDNFNEDEIDQECDIRPVSAIWTAMMQLNGKLHQEELNRCLLRTTRMSEIPEAVEKIRSAREACGGDYSQAILNDVLGEQVNSNQPSARMAAWFSLAGWGGLIIEQRVDNEGYRNFAAGAESLVKRALEELGEFKKFDSEEEWFSYFLGNEITASTSFQPITSETIQHLSSELDLVSLRYKKEDSGRLVASLLSKNFLILTGLSGSGKTKLAQAFAAWICEDEKDSELVPVGADWTSRENVLGYVDTINKSYHKAAALELILRAKANCEDGGQQTRPFFLILDEMNLSHVERYFADFLSAIESEKAIPMHNNEDEDKPGSEIWCGVPQRLQLPKNLFVIGTVNVDETTYMFSPKVLDRANTIEFRVDPKDFDLFMDEAKPIELERLRKDGKGLGFRYGPALVETAAKTVTLKGVDDAAHELLKREMGVLMRLFGATGWEFGYRTGKEVTRFVYFHKLLAGSGWEFEDALDAQIVQKLMPKLNGSEDKLRGILCALAWYSSGLVKVPEKADDEDDGAYYQKLAENFTQLAGKRNPENLAKALSEQSNPLPDATAGTEFEEIVVTASEWDSKRAKLPLTFDKTLRMWRAAKQNGFTSYAEN